MEPVAVAKARSLARYAFGVPKSSVELTLTDTEAWEFLGWYGQQLGNNPHFDSECAAAHVNQDPFPVLVGIEIQGFRITRALH